MSVTFFATVRHYSSTQLNIKASIQLTKYAITTRYPGEYDEITKYEYEKAVRIAQECLAWVENTIKEIEDKKNETI